VEAMSFLAETVQERLPQVNVQIMEDANFLKFLEITPSDSSIEVLVEVIEKEDGRIFTRLLTRKKLKALTRLTAHCELSFGGRQQEPPKGRQWDVSAEPDAEVAAERIYRELVPFGPAYRTLNGILCLNQEYAWGNLSPPKLASKSLPLGSPFALDGAMHAACVHGQQLVDFIPFPVGFGARLIDKPTSPGGQYNVQVRLCARAADQLVYDLKILDQKGRLQETVSGLRMRDVTAGQIRSPAWMKPEFHKPTGQ
jgi:Polyketide synthase dehydratase N-terminal domain